MFRKITIKLDDNYSIHAVKETDDIAIEILCNQNAIGNARLTTDDIDVSCITELAMDEKHVNHLLRDEHTLGDAFIKFLLKFPSVVRKPEFRFILEVPESLKSIIATHNFDRGDDSNISKEILIRNTAIQPTYNDLPQNISIVRHVEEKNLQTLLVFLQNNAYWQKSLTLDRLKLLLKNSLCFYAVTEKNEIVGFSRVVTNNKSFASLWDVVVDEQYRGKNIGTSMMCEIFSDYILSKIPNWILFTESAKKLYEKFGFISAADMPNRKLVQKLRLQESAPAYMHDLIQTTLSEQVIELNPENAFIFLFGNAGKRNQLPLFWKSVPGATESLQDEDGMKHYVY